MAEGPAPRATTAHTAWRNAAATHTAAPPPTGGGSVTWTAHPSLLLRQLSRTRVALRDDLPVEEVDQILQQRVAIDLKVEGKAVYHTVGQESLVWQANLFGASVDLFRRAHGDSFVFLAVNNDER